jgi:ribonucleoside-diphosphate reductase alpha chain
LAVDYLPYDDRVELGVLTSQERTQMTLPGIDDATTRNAPLDAGPPVGEAAQAAHDIPVVVAPVASVQESDSPYCFQCGVQMQRAGSCHACPSCGTTSGCS